MRRRRATQKADPKIAERLRLLLEYHGLTQRELAAIGGVSPPSVNQWLSGETSPSLGSLIRIADELDESLDFIVGRQSSRRIRGERALPFEDPELASQPTAWRQWRVRFGLFVTRCLKPWRGERPEESRKRALEIVNGERGAGAFDRLERRCLEERDLETLVELAYHAYSTTNPQPPTIDADRERPPKETPPRTIG